MKILLFTPTYKMDNGKPAMCEATGAALAALDPGGHEVIRWVSIDRKADKQANVIRQYQKARERALKENFDALLIVEHDMLPPADAIVKLAAAEAPVVYGAYMFRHGTPSINIRLASKNGFGRTITDEPARLREAVKTGWVECSGLGFGCVLIRREALQRLEFHKDTNHYPDTPFALDCVAAGIRQVARLDVCCGHIAENGATLWPLTPGGYPGGDVAVKILTSFNVVIRGELWACKAGEIKHMPLDKAGELQRANFLRIVEDD